VVTEAVVRSDRILVGFGIGGNRAAAEAGRAADRWQVPTVAAGRIIDIADSRSETTPSPVRPETPSRPSADAPNRLGPLRGGVDAEPAGRLTLRQQTSGSALTALPWFRRG